MIRTLTGTISNINPNSIVLDVNGVGYLVYSTPQTDALEVGQTITLQTYLAVRETALDLYGFIDSNELSIFELLLGVPKVGPKSALQILSQASPTLLVEAAHKNDGAYLSKLSGVGKKTSENVVQYLHGKLEQLPAVTSTDTPSELNQIQTDAIDALVSLGYELTAARDVVSKLSTEESTVNSLVTQALKQIG